MGKFIYALIMVLFIESGLYFFGGTTYENTSLFNMIFNFGGSGSSTLYIIMLSAIAGIAATTIFVGTFNNINIYAAYAGVIAVLITFFLSIMHLAQFTYGQLSDFTPQFAQLITMAIVGPIGIFYLVASMEWVRSNQ